MFQIGDAVCLIRPDRDGNKKIVPLQTIGHVVDLSGYDPEHGETTIGVDWHEPNIGHSMAGLCPDNSGWNVAAATVMKLGGEADDDFDAGESGRTSPWAEFLCQEG